MAECRRRLLAGVPSARRQKCRRSIKPATCGPANVRDQATHLSEVAQQPDIPPRINPHLAMSFSFPRFSLPSIKLTLVVLAAAASVQASSVFEVLEISPGILGRSGQRVDTEVLAQLPMSDPERQALLDGWLDPAAPQAPQRRVMAARLLENCGQPEAALAVLAELKTAEIDALQLMRLLYLTKHPEPAAAAFAQSQRELPARASNTFPQAKLERLLRPLVALGQLDETARFLAWLQPRCTISEWRSSVLSTRLDLALHQGRLPELLAALAAESATVRAVADHMLDRGGLPHLPALPADAAVADIAWCIELERCNATFSPVAEAAIRSGRGSPAERRELFRQIARDYRSTEQRQQLLLAWLIREEEFIDLYTSLAADGIGELPELPLCDLAARHPAHAYLNYLAGYNLTSVQPRRTFVGPARACLVRAVTHAPLVVRKADPSQDPLEISKAEYDRHSAAGDPARFALMELSDRMAPEKLSALLVGHADFAALPVADRLRYLQAARLDLPVWDLLREIDWSQPAHDMLGGELGHLLGSIGGSRWPEAETWRQILAKWPEMLVGSVQKPAALIAGQTDWAFRAWQNKAPAGSPAVAEFVRAWHQRLQARGPEFCQSVLAACTIFRSDQPRMEELRKILGAETASNIVKSLDAGLAFRTKLAALAWLQPPGISGFPVGYGHEDSHRHISAGAYPGWIGGQPGRDTDLLWLCHRFPSLSFACGDSYLPESRSAWTTALQLRGLLAEDSPLAFAVDLVIHRRMMEAPPEAAARAERHIAASLATRKEPDFVLYRACDGLALQHGKPARNPDALLELRALSQAPLVIRRAAADVLAATESNNSDQRPARLGEIIAAIHTEPAQYENTARWKRPDPVLNHPLRQRPDLALARSLLEKDPDDVEAADLIARTVGKSGEMAELCTALAVLRRSVPQRFFAEASAPEVLARFAKPRLDELMGLLSMVEDPSPPPVDARTLAREICQPLLRIHRFVLEQDPVVAATLRRLIIGRGWTAPLTRDLLELHEREAAIGWLAMEFTMPPTPVLPTQPLRFPQVPKAPDGPRRFDDSSILHPNTIKFILEHQIAAPLSAAIAAKADPNDRKLIAFLKLLDQPTIETYRTHFKPLMAEQDAYMAGELKKQVVRLLQAVNSTQSLAAAVAADPP